MLLAAVYAVYLLDCLVWLEPGKTGMTRTGQGWREHTVARLSFTLAGRRPLLVDPFLLRPGFVRPDAPPTPRVLQRVSRRMEAQWLLLLLCRCQAVLLLVYLPLLLWLHRLIAVWPIYLAMLLLLHACICFFAARALRSAAAAHRGTTLASLVVNPVGATRILTVLSQALFEQARKPRRAASVPKPLN